MKYPNVRERDFLKVNSVIKAKLTGVEVEIEKRNTPKKAEERKS